MALFLHINIPRDNMLELDSVSLIGAVAVVKPIVVQVQDSIQIRWTALRKNKTIKIWMATANKVKKGDKDVYNLIVELHAPLQTFSFNQKNISAEIYKIVLNEKSNTVNCWLLREASH